MKGRSSSKKHHLKKKGHEQQEKKVSVQLSLLGFWWNLDHFSFFNLCFKTHFVANLPADELCFLTFTHQLRT